ncbi:Large ribosomal subunit protein P3y-like protein [Drosera capensis]
MGVHTFVCRSADDEWTAKQPSGDDLEASAASTFDLQRKLVRAAVSVDSSGGVQTSFSLVSPSLAVFQVIVGGGGGGTVIGGGAAAAAPVGAPALEAPNEEEKKPEKVEESEDEDMMLSLFD